MHLSCVLDGKCWLLCLHTVCISKVHLLCAWHCNVNIRLFPRTSARLIFSRALSVVRYLVKENVPAVLLTSLSALLPTALLKSKTQRVRNSSLAVQINSSCCPNLSAIVLSHCLSSKRFLLTPCRHGK